MRGGGGNFPGSQQATGMATSCGGGAGSNAINVPLLERLADQLFARVAEFDSITGRLHKLANRTVGAEPAAEPAAETAAGNDSPPPGNSVGKLETASRCLSRSVEDLRHATSRLEEL